MVIDIHTHAFPDSIAELAVKKLSSSGHIPYFSNGTAKGLTESMKKAGIDVDVENVDLSRNQISSISNIAENINLIKINLNYNILTDLEGIENLTNLQ